MKLRLRWRLLASAGARWQNYLYIYSPGGAFRTFSFPSAVFLP